MRRFCYWDKTTLLRFFPSSSAAAAAVEDEDEQDDDNDPSEGVVFKEVAEASHDKPPGIDCRILNSSWGLSPALLS